MLKKNVVLELEVENQVLNVKKKDNPVKNFRDELKFNYSPPKNSLSDMVFNNDFQSLEKLLLKDMADINERDNSGVTCSWTPLYWSVKLKHVECMKVLLKAGANINLVINDYDECCGTVLDLATIRSDSLTEEILREYAEKDDINFGQSFKAIRTKLRGKAPAFNFRYYSKTKIDDVMK